MKRSIAIASLFAIAGLTASTAMADPSIIQIDFTCPSATGAGYQVLTNFGGYKIAGYGIETINGSPAFNSPYFVYMIPGGANIPGKLTTYSNSGTDFDSVTGVVSCMYTSSSTFDPFTASYQMTNGQGGQIAGQTNNTISINQFVGFTK